MFCGVNDTTNGSDSTVVTDIDGNSYPTIKICDQIWMAKNLDVARYRNGDPIPQVTDRIQWANLTTGAWCWYNNDSATYGATYGRLYNYYAVKDPRGLAPEGWHIPSNEEWITLSSCLGGTSIAGGKMKSTGTQYWQCGNVGATNESGFSGLPGGYVYGNNGDFFDNGIYGFFWSSSNPTFESRVLVCDNTLIGTSTGQSGQSVRCVKDTPGTSLNNGLVAYFPFNGNANDESGNGNHGTVNGAILTTDRFGSSGKAYSFDGVDDRIQTMNSFFNASNDFSISLWSNSISLQQNQTILNTIPHSIFSLSYNYFLHPQGDLMILYGNGQPGGWYNNGGDIFTPQITLQNIWNNIIVVKTNGNFKVIQNGVVLNTISIIQNPDSILSQINFGSCDPNACAEFFNGSLDDVRIYNRALTQEEITYLATH